MTDTYPPLEGAALIAAERERQIKKEGWTPEHDDGHGDFQLSVAARCYLIAARRQAKSLPKSFDQPLIWPWSWHWWKPSHDPIRNLVKAGALIAAEIDRLLRAKDATEAAKPDHFPDASKMVAPSVSPSVSSSVASQQPEPVKPKMPPADIEHPEPFEVKEPGYFSTRNHLKAFVSGRNSDGDRWIGEVIYDTHIELEMWENSGSTVGNPHQSLIAPWTEPPALPPKPAALEPFEIVNGNHRDWANAEDSRWFIFARADGTRQLIDKSDGWRRMEVQP